MTVENRYEAATAYVRRAISEVGGVKVEPVKNELRRVEAHWLRATTDRDRTQIAREAELLADRTKESLPGAPSDWQRTNLFKGEVETQTDSTSYASEFAAQAVSMFGSLSRGVGDITDSLGSAGKWIVLGGAVLLGLRLVGAFDRRGDK